MPTDADIVRWTNAMRGFAPGTEAEMRRWLAGNQAKVAVLRKIYNHMHETCEVGGVPETTEMENIRQRQSRVAGRQNFNSVKWAGIKRIFQRLIP